MRVDFHSELQAIYAAFLTFYLMKRTVC